MIFEWDEDKNRSNIQKHGFSFQYAQKVFDDEDRVESDIYYRNGEWRYNVIGRIKKLVFVV